MKKQIVFEDAVFTVNYSIFGGGEPTVDVVCRLFSVKGLSLDDFAAQFCYPSADAKAKMLDPAIRGSDGILRAG
jgi:hypothetical protein